jgi:hypothetical protein
MKTSKIEAIPAKESKARVKACITSESALHARASNSMLLQRRHFPAASNRTSFVKCFMYRQLCTANALKVVLRPVDAVLGRNPPVPESFRGSH